MKTKILLFSVLLLSCGSLWAQWFNNGTAIYFNDNVGIGPVFNGTTEPPTRTLDVDGTMRIRSLTANNALDSVLVADGLGNLYWRSAALLDTNTQLSEADVDNYVADNGYLTATALTPYAPLSNPNFTGNVNLTSGNLYGRFTNAAYSNLYRFGGLYLTWDSDNYGTHTHHSIRSTYGDTYGDDITINSFDNIRFNIDSNDNNTESYFEIGEHTTGTSNILFRVESPTGNVGIGTSTPSGKLEISGGSNNWNETTQGHPVGSIHLNPGNPANHYGNAITFGASDSGNGQTAQAGIYVRSDGNYGTKMYLSTTNSYATGSKTAMMIDAFGRIGIGTPNPASKFHIISSGTNDGQFRMDVIDGDEAFFAMNNGNNYGLIARSDGNSPKIGAWTGGNLQIYPYETVSGGLDLTKGPLAFFDFSSMELGIGTSNPDAKLDVNGRIIGKTSFHLGANYDINNRGIVVDNGASTSWSLLELKNDNGSGMKVLGNGYVGIGETTPQEKLHVNGNVRFTGALMPNGQAGTNDQVLTSAGAGTPPTWTDLPADTQLSEAQVDNYVANNGYAPLDSPSFTGNVGIGTPSPTAALHIKGTVDGTPNEYGTQIGEGHIELNRSGNNAYIDFKNDTGSGDYDARIRLTGDDELSIYGASLNMQDYYINSVRALRLKDWDDNSGGTDDKYRLLARDGAFMFYNGGVVVGNYNNGTWSDLSDGRLIVEDRVGIGTTSPGNKLDVVGGVDINDYIRHNGDENTHIGFPDNDQIRLRTAGTDRLTVNSSGNVGIGTPSPGAKLEVYGGGNILIKGSGDDAGDLVFQKSTGAQLGRVWTNSGGSSGLYLSSGDNNADITIDGGGNVSIKDTDNHGEDFWVNSGAGKPGGGFWGTGSDRRLKQDITPFTDGLEQIQQIKPVWYRYNGIAGFPTDEQYVGIIAQEMREVAPYTVGSFTYEDENGNSTEYLNYDGSAVTYMLVNAIKEQQQQIEVQQQENEQLKQRIETLESLMTNTGIKDGNTQSKSGLSDDFALYQNIPNPFDKTTTIEAIVPERVQQAKIIVYNLQGLELESYDISQRGKVRVEISAGHFPSGMYLYTLFADGQLIDTKKMILTR